MAGWSRCFYAYHFCGELTKTARAEISVNSIGLALPSLGVSRSIDSVPLRVRRVHLPFCLLISSMMSCCHRIRFRLCPPCLRDTCPVIWLSCCLVPPLTRFALSPRFSSLRLFAPFLVSSSGASCVSPSSRHASRLLLRACLSVLRPACPRERLRISPLCSCVPLLLCRLPLVSLPRPAYSCREAGRCREVGLAQVLLFFLCDFCAVG